MNTPLAVDTYPRIMADAFDERQIISVPTGFQSLFGNPATAADTIFSADASVVDIDILRGNEKLAATISRGGNGRTILGQKNTNDQKFTSQSRIYPLIEEEGDITADQINKRVAGEGPYSNLTKEQRMQIIAMGHHQEHVRRITRTCELLASKSILEGKMPAKIGTTNSDLIYDFRRAAGNTIAGAIAWDGVSPVIMKDIDGACQQGREQGHVNIDMGIVGGGAMEAMINDSAFQSQADNRRIDLIEVSDKNPVPPRFDRFIESGFLARGRLRTASGYEVWLFTYNEVYEDAAGTPTKYMPDDKMVLLSSTARFDRYFGPSEVLPMTASRNAWFMETFGFNSTGLMPPNIKNVSSVITPAMFYFDGYSAANGKTVTVRSQAAPIFATTQTDAVVVLTDLLT